MTGSDSKSPVHFAERTVQRWWSCKSQRLSSPHTVRERLSQPSADPATSIQALQGKSAKAVKSDVIKKANAVQFALPRLTRHAFRKETQCRMQVHETTRPQPHKTTVATRSPGQVIAEIEVADLRRNYVD
jgi:hypothetical protein